MPKSKIDGMHHRIRYEQLDTLPEEIIRRRTKYDQVLASAKKKPTKLTFVDQQKATNVYVALRARIRRDGNALRVRKRGLKVYVFAPRGMKTTRLSTRVRHSMKAAKFRNRKRRNRSA